MIREEPSIGHLSRRQVRPARVERLVLTVAAGTIVVFAPPTSGI